MVDLLNIGDATGISSAPSGLVTVPMTITDGSITEKSAVVAGMVGYKLHHHNATRIPSVEPVHGWSLLLDPQSAFRHDMSDWEHKVNGIQ